MKPILLGLLLCGCATTHVTERYALPGDAQAIHSAAAEATRRLGWTTEAVDSGKFKLVDYPRRPTPELTISAEDGVLHIDADQPVNKPELPEAARILRSATEEILTGTVRGPRVEERSTAIAVALDILAPSIGGVYALQGDPSFDSPIVGWNRSMWWDVTTRFVGDVSAALVLGYFATRLNDPFGISPMAIVVSEIAILVLNRVLSVIVDVGAITHRNAYARSGLAAPDWH